MVLEFSGKTEVEGHVGGQDCTDDQLPDLLHGACTNAQQPLLVQHLLCMLLLASVVPCVQQTDQTV